MCGIPAKKSRGRLDNGLLIDVPGIPAVRDFRLLTPLHDTLYVPISEGTYFQGMDVLTRTDGDPIRVAGGIQSRVAALDKDQMASKVETLQATLGEMLAPRRFTMVLLGIFSGISLALVVVGVYGLLHYSTVQQTRDVGIRMALGAKRIDILCMVLGQGLKLVLVGVAMGLAGALVLTRLLSSLLYDVAPTDPLALACVSLILIAIAMLASLLPFH